MANDLDKLQGTWHITSLESDGEMMPPVAFNGATIVIKGNKFKSLGMGATYEGTVELDQTQKPKTLDLLITVGHAAGTRNLGVYKLAKDQWTICLATRGTKRPEKFATKRGTGLALETLARGDVTAKSTKKKSKPAPVKSANAAPAKYHAQSGAKTDLEGEWEMVAGVFNGVAMKQDMVKWVRRVTRGNITTVVAGPQVMLKADFILDQSKEPHTIDYNNLEGPNTGKPQSGIFDLRGDTLRICMAAPAGKRPDVFSSKSGDGRSFTTWRLIKK